MSVMLYHVDVARKQLLTCLLCKLLYVVQNNPEIIMFATQLLILCYPIVSQQCVHLCKGGMYCIFGVYSRQYRSKSTARSTDTASDRQSRVKRIDMNYEYFDGGNHFCRCCNCFSVNIFEHCQHLISSAHQQVNYTNQSIFFNLN